MLMMAFIYAFLLLLSLLMPLNNSAFTSFPINNLPDQLDHLKPDQILKLHWIHSRLSLDIDQLTAIFIGHPSILNYDIEKRLDPAITFYEDALRVCVEDTDDNTKDDGNCNTTDDIVRDKLILLLCKSPQLLEYNVKKRLTPRLERVRATLGQQIIIDEETLKIIATKTDSRFDEWLYNSSSRSSRRGNSARRNDISEHQEDENRQPHSYIVLSNLQSGSNIGNILRSASIFGCKELIVVGQKRYRLTGDHGSRFDLKRHHVYSHEEAKIYLKSKGVRIYGVEIIEGAQPILQYDQETGISKFPFNRQYEGAAFLMGNEGEGLSQKQMEICDEFIFIPQTRGGSVDGGGSSSLNVACAATVILQAYCLWAGYPIAQRDGEKFVASNAVNY